MEDYAHLSPAAKVEAILATVKEPLPRDVILDFADVDTERLSEADLQQVEAVFQGWIVSGQDGNETQEYWVPPSHQAVVIGRIGVEAKSVHNRITDLAFRRLGIPME